MENASQALIIAGGILITLLIISIGVALYMSYSNTAEGVVQTWDATELAKFNSSFEAIVGRTDVSAQEIVTLISLSQQRENMIKIVVEGNLNSSKINGNQATEWTNEEKNIFLNSNILSTIEEDGTTKTTNLFSYVQDSIKYDDSGRVREIKFKKNV